MNGAIEAGGCAPPIHVEQKQRRMLQPIKDELRRQLEVANAQAAYWKGLLDDAVPMATVRKLVVVAVVIGFALGKIA